MNTQLDIQLLDGEYWWGGACQDGACMPFGRRSYSRDLRTDHGGNQAAPFLLSNRGRYIWADEAFKFAFEGNRLVVTASGAVPIQDGFDDLAGAFQAASRQHFSSPGGMPDPIAFCAPQFNSWMEMGYEPTQSRVLEYAQSIVDHGVPPGILILDDGWSEAYGDWRFHSGRFPDPKRMIARLREMGFSVMLWLVPFVSADGPVFRDLEDRRFLIRDSDDRTVVRRWWNGKSAVLDFTHPQVVDWLQARLDALVHDFGVAGFKMDAGDPDVFLRSDRAHRSMEPSGYTEAWGRIGLRYRLSEYRACWKLGGASAIQRLRDKHHRWGRDGLRDLIPNSLAQGLMGHSFVCPDMVGGGDIGTSFGTPIDGELFVRTAQCSMLFPMVQFSMAPWRVLDRKHWDHCRGAIDLRQRLAPEILDLAFESARAGEPMMRHLAYAYPQGGYEEIVDQFLLGDRFLVAPVLEPGARSRPVVFPPGVWAAEDGQAVEGPKTLDVNAPLGRLPWFRKTAPSDRPKIYPRKP
jgi:alpha-glucosidase (family GH31 glycosyl hydrolase)